MKGYIFSAIYYVAIKAIHINQGYQDHYGLPFEIDQDDDPETYETFDGKTLHWWHPTIINYHMQYFFNTVASSAYSHYTFAGLLHGILRYYNTPPKRFMDWLLRLEHADNFYMQDSDYPEYDAQTCRN